VHGSIDRLSNSAAPQVDGSGALLHAAMAEIGNKVPVDTRFGRRGWHTQGWHDQNQSIAHKRDSSNENAITAASANMATKAETVEQRTLAPVAAAHPAAARLARVGTLPTSAKLNSELYHTVCHTRPHRRRAPFRRTNCAA
jgi:hypothetical protein